MYTISQEAEFALAGTGLANRLEEVIKKSAIITHPQGNRRFHGWIFDVQGTRVVRATKLDSEREFIVYEECPGCRGTGWPGPKGEGSKCSTCKGDGEIKVTRRLPPEKHLPVKVKRLRSEG